MKNDRYRDEDDALPMGLIALVLCLLLIAGFTAWWWMTRDPAAPSQVEAPAVNPEPLPEPEPEPEPEPMPAPIEPDPEPAPEPAPEAEPEPEPIIEPAPEPAPDPVRMTVYFELMSSKLSDEAVREIAARTAGLDLSAATSIRVEGFTDTAGSVAYNLPLSKGRTSAVAAALAAAGAPAGGVQTEWFGETRLATETGDGVREPLNRRATIEIRFD
ncbi:MAG: OmpA family protein [Alphaproteobacteria bacterium]|nr:OmpA family protein [Alphaproteobacteria bacterium]